MLQDLIEQAKNGDSHAALSLINEFVSTVKANRNANGEPHRKPSGTSTQFDEKLLDYFADCFSQIGSYSDEKTITAGEALHLTARGQRGRKTSHDTRDKSLIRGMLVWKKKRAGEKLQAALIEVADLENVAVDTAERDYKEFVRTLSDAHENIRYLIPNSIP